MFKKKGFTLVEVLLVTMIASSIIIIVYSLLDTLPKVKNFNDARQTLIQQVNDAMDRFTVIFQDYTIDYEEYYNRRALGCSTGGGVGDDFEWNVGLSGYCSIRTHYGNHHGESSNHSLSYGETTDSIENVDYEPPYSYGEYKRSFWDFGVDTDGSHIGQKPASVGDADDRDLGIGDVAVGDPENVQELYLISHDKTKRIFLRRKFNPYSEADAKLYGSSGWYTVQILKLRGFDAGNKHSYKNPSTDLGVFDGQIDTWACDAGQYFVCGSKLNTEARKEYDIDYPGGVHYYRPTDIDDGWVDLFDEKLNILNWNIELYPVKDQELAWKEINQHINPYFKITFTAGLSDHLFSNRNWGGTGGFTYSLENIYDTKGFYIQ